MKGVLVSLMAALALASAAPAHATTCGTTQQNSVVCSGERVIQVSDNWKDGYLTGTVQDVTVQGSAFLRVEDARYPNDHETYKVPVSSLSKVVTKFTTLWPSERVMQRSDHWKDGYLLGNVLELFENDEVIVGVADDRYPDDRSVFRATRTTLSRKQAVLGSLITGDRVLHDNDRWREHYLRGFAEEIFDNGEVIFRVSDDRYPSSRESYRLPAAELLRGMDSVDRLFKGSQVIDEASRWRDGYVRGTVVEIFDKGLVIVRTADDRFPNDHDVFLAPLSELTVVQPAQP